MEKQSISKTDVIDLEGNTYSVLRAGQRDRSGGGLEYQCNLPDNASVTVNHSSFCKT